MYHRMSNDIDEECKALANVHLPNQEELDDIQNQLKVSGHCFSKERGEGAMCNMII